MICEADGVLAARQAAQRASRAAVVRAASSPTDQSRQAGGGHAAFCAFRATDPARIRQRLLADADALPVAPRR
eukprot:3519037-Alexandrium_andersonii.AAC.1